MQRVKPIRFDVKEDNKTKEIKKIKPKIIAKEGTKEFNNIIKEMKEEVVIKEELIKNTTIKFYSFFTFIILVFTIFLMGLIYEAYLKFRDIFAFNEIFGVAYLSLMGILSLLIVIFIYNQRKGYKSLKRVDDLQLRGKKLLKNPSKESIKYLVDMIKEYEKNSRNNSKIKEGISELKIRLNSSLFHDEVIGILNEHLMKPLDEKAEKAILKYSKNSALLSAISPIAIVDILILFWQNYRLSIEIAKIYGFKPSFTSNLILFKKVIENLIFAGVSEAISESVTNSIFSKISYALSQGLTNGVLTIRVGLSAMKLSRPVPFEKEESFFKRIFTLMSRVIKNRKDESSKS